MSQPNPILNSPYEEPTLHYRTLVDGKLDYEKQVEGRRTFNPFTNQPVPIKKGRQGAIFDQDQANPDIQNHLVNLLRREVGSWRQQGYPQVTRVTKELLNFWFNNPERISIKKLFFAQQEALETAVWLNEVADKTPVGQSILQRLQKAREKNHKAPYLLPRLSFKMATGTGKTVVMGMLILYHYFNRQEYASDTRFADYFLLIAPGITIRDRLAVLRVNTEAKSQEDTNDYYTQRGLIPEHYRKVVEGLNARLAITNYHSFELRTLQGNKRGVFDGKVDADGNKQVATEDPSQMVKRVISHFKRDRRLLILNDEAHHCYLPIGKSSRDDKNEDERASVWINGIAQISQYYKLQNVYDLSATPYYLTGSGRRPGTLFPWVVSDFGLIEAIESGLVKIPFLPHDDTTQQLDEPVLKNLYDHVRDELPKKGRKNENLEGEPQIPALVKQAFEQFYGHYAKEFQKHQQAGLLYDSPPVFIIVCNNTNVSSEMYRYIAGYEILDDEGNVKKTVQGIAPLFSNYDEYERAYDRPRTLLIDSFALETSDQVDDTFKKIFAHEIENFKREYRTLYPDRSVDNITDSDILREVINTVGKRGKLGAHVRCVVSVSMLTEGWDANTVTHVMGLRAFGSQLLCEQVAGRALRRKDYHLVRYDKNDEIIPEGSRKKAAKLKYPPEYAHIIGVPFKLFKGGETVTPPPQDFHRIKALPDRAHLEIKFPKVNGYRIEMEDKQIRADFSKIQPYPLDGSIYPTETTMESAFMNTSEKLSLDNVKERRRQELEFHITRHLLNLYFRDEENNREFHLFQQVRDIVAYWINHKVKCIGDAFINMLFFEDPKQVCRHIYSGIEAYQGQNEVILPILHPYEPFGSTEYVNGLTTRKVWETTKSHVNYVVADTDSWEQIAAKSLEEMEEVISYVKNAYLRFEIPYIDAYGQERKYITDFIAVIQLPSGEQANLMLEITGFNQDKEMKRQYVSNRWLPAVNRIRHKNGYAHWDFLEINGEEELKDIKNLIRQKIKALDAELAATTVSA